MQILTRFKSNSKTATNLFWRLQFQQNIRIIAVICLFAILFQGIIIIRFGQKLQQDIEKTNSQIAQAIAVISSLKVTSEALLSRCQSSLLAGTGLEVTDLLSKIGQEIAKLPKQPKSPDLKPFKQEYNNLKNKLAGYQQTGLNKTDYLTVKKSYSDYIETLNHLAQIYDSRNQTGLAEPLIKQIWFFLFLLVIFVVIILIGGKFLYTAVKTILKPAKVITKTLDEATDKLFQVSFKLNSSAGLGNSALVFQESLNHWNKILLDSGNSIRRYDTLCRELVTEIRKTELFAIQLQQVAESLNENFTNQNMLLSQANEQLGLLSKNNEDLHKIPQKLLLIRDDLQSQIIAIEKQITEILNRPLEHRDVSNEIADLAKDLQKASIQITDIVSILKDVAEQTELLALNTAIQAARAGNKGLGFGVVASEIAKLVNQSDKASSRLHDFLFKIQATNDEVINLIEQNSIQPEPDKQNLPANIEISNICNSVFLTARESLKNIAGLSTVMGEIFNKSNTLAKEANMISTLSLEDNDSYKTIDLEILDYQLNVKEVNRMAVKIGETSEELRKLTETESDQEKSIF